MFSANTEKGPVTPRMVSGWIESLAVRQSRQKNGHFHTYKEKIIPQMAVLNTTSMVPQFAPVKTYRSLANVMPGNRLVKKT